MFSRIDEAVRIRIRVERSKEMMLRSIFTYLAIAETWPIRKTDKNKIFEVIRDQWAENEKLEESRCRE